MTDYYTVKRLALVLAVQAEIEGMKAENLYRIDGQHSVAYTNKHFQSKACELENLAHAHDEQL
jgi:hypothetical protein